MESNQSWHHLFFRISIIQILILEYLRNYEYNKTTREGWGEVKMDKHTMTEEQQKRFWDFIMMDDFEFYDRFISDLPPESQNEFFRITPDFFSEYINTEGRINLDEDEIYQKIKEKINIIEKNSPDT